MSNRYTDLTNFTLAQASSGANLVAASNSVLIPGVPVSPTAQDITDAGINLYNAAVGLIELARSERRCA